VTLFFRIARLPGPLPCLTRLAQACGSEHVDPSSDEPPE
jgi:hypothetical protein